MRPPNRCAAHGSGDHSRAFTALDALAAHAQAFAPETIASSHSVAGQVEHNAVVSKIADAPNSGGHFHEMTPLAHSFGHAGGQPQTMIELLHGSTGPAHAQVAGSTPVTAASVMMPSAQQLAAAAVAHGTAQAQTSVAGQPVQHNEVVGKVLADSLHGGQGSGPNIDALLNSLPSHGAAHDALEALASHAGTAVPFGHMAFSAAFGGPSGVLAMEMMHHAAVPAHG